MVCTKLLMFTLLFVAVCADFNWYGQTGFPGFGQNFNNIPTAPPLPMFGQNFPNYPSFPNMNFPNMNFPSPNFPNMNFPSPNFPTGVDISKVSPAPGATYNGIAVQSVSEVKKDKDGNLIKNGGTTVITNRNGEVNKYETGDNPPKMDENPTFRPIQPQYQYPTFNPPDFSKFKPSDNTQYSSISSSSYSSSSDVNGVKKSGGAIHTSVDVNGDKKEQSYVFGDGV